MDRRTPFLAALLIGLGSFAAAADSARATANEAPLFSRLGGSERVAAFVNATIDELAAHRGADAFGVKSFEGLKTDLAARICAVSGGGCRASRLQAHAALQTGSELVEALRVAMRTHGVPLAARNELLEALAPARDLARL
jgi:hypothetical protein